MVAAGQTISYFDFERLRVSIMRLTFALSVVLFVAFGLFVGNAQAVSTFYFSDQDLGTAAPGVPNITGAMGTTGELGLYVQTAEAIAGISLDIVAAGDAIRLTGATVPNPAAPAPALGRWFAGLVSNGTVATDGLSISAIEGAALVGLAAGGTGLDPAMADPTSGFLFATLAYEVVGGNGTSSTIDLRIGRNAIGPVTAPLTIHLGPGNQVENMTGATSEPAEAMLTVGGVIIPEPSTAILGLACIGMLGFVRRRR
jgi:hypothetical protein